MFCPNLYCLSLTLTAQSQIWLRSHHSVPATTSFTPLSTLPSTQCIPTSNKRASRSPGDPDLTTSCLASYQVQLPLLRSTGVRESTDQNTSSLDWLRLLTFPMLVYAMCDLGSLATPSRFYQRSPPPELHRVPQSVSSLAPHVSVLHSFCQVHVWIFRWDQVGGSNCFCFGFEIWKQTLLSC